MPINYRRFPLPFYHAASLGNFFFLVCLSLSRCASRGNVSYTFSVPKHPLVYCPIRTSSTAIRTNTNVAYPSTLMGIPSNELQHWTFLERLTRSKTSTVQT